MKENKISKEFRDYSVKHLGLPGTTVDDVVKHQTNVHTNSLTPMILEERELRVTQMSVFDRLLIDRILWISGGVDQRMASVVQAQLMFLDSIDKKRDVTMHLDTPGGSVLSGLAIRDVMNYVDCDISTINVGMCASMGSILVSSGTKGKRCSLIFSKIMTHMVSHGSSGNVQETRINQLEAEKYNFMLFKILAENCGKTFDEIYEISRTDRWFLSDEALNFGLIDEIVGLNKDRTITNYMDGFEDYYTKEVLKK
jgi:ATP-dependent Clp protease protease subunit